MKKQNVCSHAQLCLETVSPSNPPLIQERHRDKWKETSQPTLERKGGLSFTNELAIKTLLSVLWFSTKKDQGCAVLGSTMADERTAEGTQIEQANPDSVSLGKNHAPTHLRGCSVSVFPQEQCWHGGGGVAGPQKIRRQIWAFFLSLKSHSLMCVTRMIHLGFLSYVLPAEANTWRGSRERQGLCGSTNTRCLFAFSGIVASVSRHFACEEHRPE